MKKVPEIGHTVNVGLKINLHYLSVKVSSPNPILLQMLNGCFRGR